MRALRSDFGAKRPIAPVIRGAAAVAGQALLGSAIAAARLHPVLVNGGVGVIVTVRGRPFTIMGFTVSGGRIVEIDGWGDPERVRRIAAAVLADAES